jgi:thermostable 8-oxoguanine DNA glycosylase
VVELKLLFSTIVAGKSATFAYKALHRLVSDRGDRSPLEHVRALMQTGQLRQRLEEARTGNYTKLERCYQELAYIDPHTVTVEELERIHGIGPKTARFFVVWTRPEARHAVLDVHVLRWLREQGHDAPNHTPTGKKYEELERVFLDYADRMGWSPYKLDRYIWDQYNKSGVNETTEEEILACI